MLQAVRRHSFFPQHLCRSLRFGLPTALPLLLTPRLPEHRPFFSGIVGMTGTKRPAKADAQSASAAAADSIAPKKSKIGDRNLAQELLDFINEAWTQFHAVGAPGTAANFL